MLHEKNGFIVPSNSPGEIAKRLKNLVKNAELRNRMKHAALQHYQDNFTEQRMVDNLAKVIDKLLIINWLIWQRKSACCLNTVGAQSI